MTCDSNDVIKKKKKIGWVLTVVYSVDWQLSLIAETSSSHLWGPFLYKEVSNHYDFSYMLCVLCAEQQHKNNTTNLD